jgi:hypothetical protein
MAKARVGHQRTHNVDPEADGKHKWAKRQIHIGTFKKDKRVGLGRCINYDTVDKNGGPVEILTGGFTGMTGDLHGRVIREAPRMGVWIDYGFWSEDQFNTKSKPIKWRFRDCTYYEGTIKVFRNGNKCEGEGTLVGKEGEVHTRPRLHAAVITTAHTRPRRLSGHLHGTVVELRRAGDAAGHPREAGADDYIYVCGLVQHCLFRISLVDSTSVF